MHGLRVVVATLLAVSLAAGCDSVFGLDGDSPGGTEAGCGDGVLAQTEDCDDGNGTAGDGCDASCAIEPGFECPPARAGSACLPVVGLVRGPVVTMLPVVGDMPSEPSKFDLECPADEVVIGVEGYANSVGDNLGNTRAVCAALTIGAGGVVQWTRTQTLDPMDGERVTAQPPVVCGPNEVATGYVPYTNTYISRLDWQCRPVTHVDGGLQLGPTRSQPFGTMAGMMEMARQCPDNQVLTSFFGFEGSSLVRVGFGCSELSAVVCGDGKVMGPETCDDGDLLRHDGCDERCQLE